MLKYQQANKTTKLQKQITANDQGYSFEKMNSLKFKLTKGKLFSVVNQLFSPR